MSSSTIMLIESSRTNAPSFAAALEKKGYSVHRYHKVDSALKASDGNKPDLVVLDAASMGTSGTRMCRKVREHLNGLPIILISLEGSRPSSNSGASLTLVHPFTPRKLLNRVARLLPADERYLLRVGPINLNTAQRKVRCLERESRLTPKQVELLKLFLRSPGRVISRKSIIRLVWKTDYTGDTRTLDVHMSWLRQAIEPDRDRPRFLRTIRGVGYRLDLPEE